MILTSLTLENIGSFYGQHEIELQPKDPKKPIVLIGALNGSGKTTILESLQLVLYGRRAKSLFRINSGYDEYVRKLFSRKASPNDQARIELAFTNDEAGNTVQYRVVRSWTFRTKQPLEMVDVFVDSRLDTVLSENWDEEVERLIPRNLSHLFFFDGERIETLADPSRSAEILRTGIYSLLGIELVDQLHADLNIYRRRLKKTLVEPEDVEHISRIELELVSQNSLKMELGDRSASIMKDLDAAKKKLRDARDNFEKHGGKFYENRSALEKERIEISFAVNQVDDALRDHCAHALPLCAAETELRSLLDTAGKERQSIDAGKLLSSLTSRDKSFLGWLTAQSSSSDELLEKVKVWLDHDRSALHRTADLEPQINMTDTTLAQLSTFLSSGMTVELQTVNKLLDQRRQMSARLDVIDRSMEMMPEESVIQTYLEKKAHAEAQCVLLTKENDRLDEQANQIRVAALQKEKELDRLLFGVKHAELASEETQRLADYSARVQHVLDELKQQTLISHLSNLEKHISEAFRRLLRKTSLVQSVHIDPSTFNVTLSSKDGHSIEPQLIAAGERQILAIALLWGLGRAAGRKIPIVIDTPLGRLDSVHRRKLVEEYFPEASHQVILLSTDEEIDEELSSDLADSIGHRYILDYDDKAEFTSVKRGYFWH